MKTCLLNSVTDSITYDFTADPVKSGYFSVSSILGPDLNIGFPAIQNTQMVFDSGKWVERVYDKNGGMLANARNANDMSLSALPLSTPFQNVAKNSVVPASNSSAMQGNYSLSSGPIYASGSGRVPDIGNSVFNESTSAISVNGSSLRQIYTSGPGMIPDVRSSVSADAMSSSSLPASSSSSGPIYASGSGKIADIGSSVISDAMSTSSTSSSRMTSGTGVLVATVSCGRPMPPPIKSGGSTS